jgi:hypothetical protein
MTDDQQSELARWRGHVDEFIAESSLYRRGTAIRMDALEKNLDANTSMTQEMHSALGEAIPVILDMRGAARLAAKLGTAIKPIAGIGAFLVAVWVWIKTGKWELL